MRREVRVAHAAMLAIQACAAELAANQVALNVRPVDELPEKLVDRLASGMSNIQTSYGADLECTTVGKTASVQTHGILKQHGHAAHTALAQGGGIGGSWKPGKRHFRGGPHGDERLAKQRDQQSLFSDPVAAIHSSRAEYIAPIRPDGKLSAKAFFSTIKSVAARYEKRVDDMYEKSYKIKCPFFRRRAFDTLEAMKRILLFIAARHKSMPCFPNPPAQHPVSKTRHLPLVEIAARIHQDWQGKSSGKGYYITGALTKEIYEEDCLFDGPDPDMPVRGLRKYLLAASHLFDSRQSRADLTRPIEFDTATGTVTAYWRLQGVINLPWHPEVKPWTGSTTYHVDPVSGLVSKHVEHWDISVSDAFISTLLPGLALGAPAAEAVDHLVIGPPRPIGPRLGRTETLL